VLPDLATDSQLETHLYEYKNNFVDIYGFLNLGVSKNKSSFVWEMKIILIIKTQ